MEVLVCVDSSLVEIPVSVLSVACLLMSINKPVDVVQDLVLVVHNLAGCWSNIEWHAVVSLDAHELVVRVHQWVCHGARPEVSIKLLKGPVCHYD